jgi:ribosomal protein S17
MEVVMSQCSDKILTVEVEKLTDEELVLRYMRRQAQLHDFHLTPQIRLDVESDMGLIINQIKRRGMLIEN